MPNQEDAMECGEIRADLRELKRRMGNMEATSANLQAAFEKHCTLETVVTGGIQSDLSDVRVALGDIKDALEDIKLQRAEEKGQFTGAQWMLAKIGMVVVMAFSFIGFAISQGWLPVKRLFLP